jgi:hypothetical protein
MTDQYHCGLESLKDPIDVELKLPKLIGILQLLLHLPDLGAGSWP